MPQPSVEVQQVDGSTATISTAVVVVAAGSGARLGAGRPKALVSVDNRTILEHALQTIFGLSDAVHVVVVAPFDNLGEATQLCERLAGSAREYLTVVTGGATRQQSVAAGLAVLGRDIHTVLVHDAARAFAPAEQFMRVARAVEETGAGVIPVLAVVDAIKQTDAAGHVTQTVDRSQLVAAQTPQGFPRATLDAAYASATEEFPDDAALYLAAGHAVSVVAGDVLAFKITTPWDLRRAEVLAREAAARDAVPNPEPRPYPVPRTGLGIDAHAFDAAAELWLGTLFWPGEAGLAGHSDGDALSHALCDALLSAAGLGDIGQRFGTADPLLAGAHGEVFIRETVRLVTAAGYAIGNVAVQVVAKHPKLAPRRIELEETLSALVGAPVSVSATTTDGLGFTGRGEGISVLATALVYSSR